MRGQVRLGLALALAGCGGGGAKKTVDAGASAAVDAVVDAAAAPLDLAACGQDAPTSDGAMEVGNALAAAGTPWCGGALDLAGVTPFGVFAPTDITTGIGVRGQQAMVVTVADASANAAKPGAQSLTFTVPWSAADAAYVGKHHVSGLLLGGGLRTLTVTVDVEVTSAPDPYDVDGGAPVSGEAQMNVTVTTPCGSFGGTLIARYCTWQILL